MAKFKTDRVKYAGAINNLAEVRIMKGDIVRGWQLIREVKGIYEDLIRADRDT